MCCFFRERNGYRILFNSNKLAVIIWNVVKVTPNINPEGYLFLDQKRKLGLVKSIKKQIDKFGLTEDDLGLKPAEF